MKDLTSVEITTFGTAKAFLEEMSKSENTTFGGWKNTVKYALVIALVKHGIDAHIEATSLGYKFIGVKSFDKRSQEPKQLINRFVTSGLLALETNSPEYVFEFTEAWTLYKVRLRTSQSQKGRASKPRAKSEATEVIKELSYRNGSALELWPVFLNEIDCQHENDGTAFYLDLNDIEKTIKFKTFSNKLSKERNNPD